MRPTGIVRKIDDLGRIIIPTEIRRNLGIGNKDSIEIYVHNESIVIKKYIPTCMFCSETIDIVEYESKNICKKCLDKISKKYIKENV